MLIRLLSLEQRAIGSFNDLKANSPFYKEIMTAYYHGILLPDSENYINIDSPLSRETMAFILVSGLKSDNASLPFVNPDVLMQFEDYSDISKEALSPLAILNVMKVLNGKTSDRLSPKDYTTRAEAAVVLYRIIKSLKIN